MPLYAKFLKEILSKKRKIAEEGIVNLTATCSAIIQQKLPAKMKDPDSFTIPYSIGKYEFKKAFCDSGASINLMPLSVVQRLNLGELTPIAITLQMADRSKAQPEGILEDVLVKVGKFIFPVDFVIMQMEEDTQVPLLLGRPFLATGAALIDVQKGELTLRVGNEAVHFNIKWSLEHPNVEEDSCMVVRNNSLLNDELNFDCILQHSINEIEMNFQYLESLDCEVLPSNLFNKETVSSINENSQDEVRSQKQQTHEQETSAEGLTLKELANHLKYEFLEPEKRKPVIISAALTEAEVQKLLVILRKYKEAIAWSIEDLKGISPSICMHKILLEDNAKTSIEHQRRLNPVMKEVIRKEVLKWLNAGFIYAISDSSWVSPVHVVPKKGGFTVIRNEKNELIPIRTVTGWRVCIDYKKLNTATRKDHFPLPFIDQMLDRLTRHPHFCFLDGYSGYNQIAIAPEDKEKTTFTCLFGTFAFRRMPFGLCNAPGTFQRCMMSIFSDLAEEVMEIFMDDFTVYGSSFEQCLHNLGTVLQRCKDKNLALNWKKIHFMVTEGIVLGHMIYAAGLEVDQAKVSIIRNLMPPTTVKGIRSFLGHACEKFRPYILGSHVVIHTDHAAIKYLMAKKEAKPRLIRWVLLLQEFYLEIKDKKCSDNVIADHLSRVEKPIVQEERSEIAENFPNEQLFQLSLQSPWYADIVNFLACGIMPPEFSYQQRKKLRTDSRYYIWDVPLLFKRGADLIIRICVPEGEQSKILQECHASPYGGHFSGDKTAQKIIQSGFYWPTIFKDCFEWVKLCDQCQRMGNIRKRHEMPLHGILVVQLFDVWGMDFMGPFPVIWKYIHTSSCGLCIKMGRGSSLSKE